MERRRKLDWELRLSRDVTEAFSTKPTATIKRDPELTLVSLEEGAEFPTEKNGIPSVPPSAHSKEREDEDARDRYFFHPDSELIGEPDPLHLPTLFRLSSALLGALGKRLVASLVERPQARPHAGYTVVENKQLADPEGEDWAGWSLSKWGIAGIAFAIGYCAARILAK